MTRKRKIRIVLLVVIPIVLIAMFLLQQYVVGGSSPKGSDPAATAGSPRGGAKVIPVTVTIAAEQEVVDGIRAVGSLMPNEEVDIASEVQGKVTAIEFAEGSSVKKGQILVRVNDDDLQAQRKQLEFKKKTLGEKVERQRILFAQEAVSQESYDQVVTEYNVLLADIELLEVKISRTKILAPFSGIIGFRYISEGSYIQPATRIARLVDYNTLKVEFSIPEKYIGTKLAGKPVRFTTESGPTEYHATIYAMEPRVDNQTRTIVIRALYNNASGTLRPGMSARVTIPTSNATKMLMLPTETIVPSLDGKSIWIVKNGKPELTPVETGNRNEAYVEVISGLAVGDSVINTGIMQLREGAAIKVTN